MAELTQTDMIWNRACGEDSLRAMPGDRALADLLYAHGLAMNGGILHAVECLTVEELSAALAGYRYYGLDDIASLFSRASEIVTSGRDVANYEALLNKEYLQIIPSDGFLSERFENRLKSSPSDFAPLRPNDKGLG